MSTKDNPYSLERLADRAAIQDVIFRWCRGIDRLDFEAIRSAFHPDAIDHHGAYDGGVDGMCEWIRDRHKPIPFSMHFVGNMLIEFAGKDEAIVETYVIAIQRYPAEARKSLVALVGELNSDAEASDLMVPARYVDRMTRKNGEWRIQTRTVVFDSVMLVDAPSTPKSGVPALEMGRRDFQDSIYKYLLNAGIRAV